MQSAQADPVAGLIDIPLPEPVSLWPQTWPLRIAVVVVAVAIVAALVWFIRHRRANRYRREALAELDAIGGRLAAAESLAELSMLLRRTALAVFPRDTVAPLAGPAWLAFLDRSYGGQGFSNGAGRLLASAPYARTPPDPQELRSLAVLVRRWIRGHHA